MFIKHKVCSLLLVLCSTLWVTNSTALICSSDADTLIPDDSINGAASDANPGSPVSIDIVIPAGSAGTITDLDIQLAIDITFVGDLIVTLTSPSGTTIDLINRPGRADDGSGGGGFGCGNDDISVTLDDSSTTPAEGQCPATTPTITGTLSPTDSLSAFNGEPLSGTWTLTAVDFFPLDQGTFISANNCISATTTPVTVSSVKTRQTSNRLIFDWQTSSEAFNLGFHVWGLIDDEWQQLNNRLIAAKSIDSVTPSDYRRRIKLDELSGEVTQVGLSALSTSGQEDFYGPFEIGESYGDVSVPRKIDWAEQRKNYDAARKLAGYVRINNRWVKDTENRNNNNNRQLERYPDVVLSVEQSGVYRITHEELVAQGIDLTRMPIKKLAITNDGIAVPRIVNTDDNAKRFGSGSQIIFAASGPDQFEARYVDNERYRITLDSNKVIDASLSNETVIDLSGDIASSEHQQTVSFGERNAYLFALPGDDPWYDTALRAFGQTMVHSINVEVPETASLDLSSRLSLSLVGGFEFEPIDVDGDGVVEPLHHFKIYVNRAEFPDAVYEGFSNGLDAVQVQTSLNTQLVSGNNQIDIELIPDNGYQIDAMFLLNGALSYSHANVFDGESLSFAVGTQLPVIEIFDKEQKLNSAYSFDGNGNFAKVMQQRFNDGKVLLASPANAALEVTPSLWLASERGYLSPSAFRIDEVEVAELSLELIDYVVIADPSLIGEDLQRFVDVQSELGRVTKVVDVQDVYNQYSDGRILPNAVADYLAEQVETSGFKYVLLVGGHTYNYRGYSISDGEAPITMIPSFYREAEYISKQIPTAVPFVDFDQDGFPDRAIGRWPVRDLVQLKNVVDKTLLWHAQGSHKDNRSSLFIADAQDGLNDFTSSSDFLTNKLGLPTDLWAVPNKVYLDEITTDDNIPQNEKLTTARNALVDGVNQGPALTVFSGHGAPVTWGAQRVLNADIADGFTNTNAPSLMMPLACYTTYYETPNVKSLSEILLTDSDAGAVALTGAALLSSTLENQNFASAILADMTIGGVDLGTAVLNRKQSMRGGGLGRTGMVFNWVTLGDPTLSFGLPDVTPRVEEGEPNQQR